MSMGDSFSMASLAILRCQALPSAISEACMICTRPLLPSTLIDLRSLVTGRAFSSSVPCQPPAPKLCGPPIMMRPAPWSCVLARKTFCCSSVMLSAGNVGQHDGVELGQDDGELGGILRQASWARRSRS